MAARKNTGSSPTILGNFFAGKDHKESHSERELLLQKAHVHYQILPNLMVDGDLFQDFFGP